MHTDYRNTRGPLFWDSFCLYNPRQEGHLGGLLSIRVHLAKNLRHSIFFGTFAFFLNLRIGIDIIQVTQFLFIPLRQVWIFLL